MSKQAARFTTVNIFHYLNRYMVPAILPAISLDLALNHTQEGVIVSSFVFGYFITSPIFGFAGDRVSKLKVMRLSVLGWGLFTALCAFPVTFISLAFLRVLVGVGQAGFVTLAPPFLKSVANDPNTLTRTLSYFFAAIPVGAALGYVTGGFLADAFSWRIAFLAGGSAACASIFLLPSFATQLEAKNESSLSFKESLSCTIKSKPITNAILGYALHTFALTSVGAFIPTYGVTFGFSLSEISTIFGAILVVAGALGTILGGKIVQKYAASSKSWGQAYFRFTSFTTLIAIPFFATCFWTSDWRLFLVACAIAELFVFAGVASLNSILVNECSPSLVAFTQGATVFTINLLGSLPGPIITGLIADKWGLAFALQVTTIALLSSGIIWLKGSVIITKK